MFKQLCGIFLAISSTTVLADCRTSFDAQGDEYLSCDDGTAGPTGCHLDTDSNGSSTVRCDAPGCSEGVNAEGEPTAICPG